MAFGSLEVMTGLKMDRGLDQTLDFTTRGGVGANYIINQP
jgi:hypothetical protein